MGIVFASLNCPDHWWFYTSAGSAVLTMLLTFVGAPIFFKTVYETAPIEDSVLVEKIKKLCARAGVDVTQVLLFRMSKETKKV
ncbi:hypothetical protein ABTQ08_20905, partial [Acinetobacter baumannii]